jgi:hypothetical protein
MNVNLIILPDGIVSRATGTIQFAADGSMIYGAGDGSHFQGLGEHSARHWGNTDTDTDYSHA